MDLIVLVSGGGGGGGGGRRYALILIGQESPAKFFSKVSNYGKKPCQSPQHDCRDDCNSAVWKLALVINE